MNNSSLLTYNNGKTPAYEYEETYTYVKGNVFRNNVDRISDVCKVYAFAFFDTYYIKLFTNEDRAAFCSYAILPDDEETMSNTFPADTFKDVIPIGPVETGSAELDKILENINISFLMNQLFAQNNITTGLSGLITMYLQNEDTRENDNGMFINCLRYTENDTSLGLYQVSRFIKHKIDFIFYKYGNYVYAFSDCDKLVGRVKIVRYEATGDTILAQAKKIYSCNALRDYSILTPVPFIGNLTDIHILYEGQLTTYKSIDVRDDLDIILDGYSNDYGSYSNVNNAIIQPKFISCVEDGNSYPAFSLGCASNDKTVEYELSGFGEITPEDVYITYDASILDASIDFTYIDQESGSTVGSVVQLTDALLDPSTGYFDITQPFMEVFNPTRIKFKLIFSEYTDYVSDNIQLVFHLTKIGKRVTSYVTIPGVGDSSVHEGQYSYTNLAGKTLCVNYTNYTSPTIKIYGGIGCLIEGTKILMADGSEKNIEDIQIGEYILNSEGNAEKVIWNQPRNHKKADHYVLYELPDGKTLGVIADERILWNGKYTFISTISEIKHSRIDGEYVPYELWTTGNDTIIANGIVCGKIYSGVKCKFIRNILKWLYSVIFLHNKDYEFINKLHTFISQKIFKHKINF